MEAQHDLRSPIPASGDVFSHVTCVLLGVLRETSGKTEIANLELAISVDEQISGFQVSVQDVRRMDVLETTKDLVDEGLEMGVGQGLPRPDDGSQITFHQLYLQVSNEPIYLDDVRTFV